MLRLLIHTNSLFTIINCPYSFFQAYESDLVSINNLDEHGFLLNQLLWQDPQHRKWYISAHEQTPGYWVNEGDGTPLTDMDAAFLPESDTLHSKPNLVYRYLLSYFKILNYCITYFPLFF